MIGRWEKGCRVVALMFVLAFPGCTTLRHRVHAGMVPLEITPTRLNLTVTYMTLRRQYREEPMLRAAVVNAVRKQLPSVTVVGEDDEADVSLQVIVTTYEPGCQPRCAKFPTYREWTCHVSSLRGVWVDVLEAGGATYNPLVSPASRCVSALVTLVEGINRAEP